MVLDFTYAHSPVDGRKIVGSAWPSKSKSLARPVPTALYDSLGEAIEVRLFDEAAAHIAGDQMEARAPALEDAVTTGVLGPLARLLAVGVHHPAVPPRLDGESAAQVIARVFPHAERAVVPRSVGLLA